jgi:hypothetical protein
MLRGTPQKKATIDLIKSTALIKPSKKQKDDEYFSKLTHVHLERRLLISDIKFTFRQRLTSLGAV